MTKTLLFLSGLLFCLNVCTAQLKIDYQHFVTLFNTGKYKQAYDEALALRVKPYGKKPVLDYFIAKSLCASGQYAVAKKGYGYILSEYDLKKEQRKFIVDEMTLCDQASAAPAGMAAKLGYLAMAGATNSNVALVMGKIGYQLDCSGNDQAYVFNPNANFSAYDERLFNLNALDTAVAYYRKFFKNKYKVEGKGRFVYITQHNDRFDFSQITQRLNDAYTFYTVYFGIREPDKIITVYLMDDKHSLRKVAQESHGLTLPNSNIGYSYLNDLSVLGISDGSSIGTIYHELFHIIIRTDLGDIPGWLDEGIACLYSTSVWEGNLLKGMKHQWRTEVLQNYVAQGKAVPTLAEIIRNNWSEFSKNESTSICDVALNYAVSHHFAIYLQEKNLLRKVVVAFKNRQNVFTDPTAVNEPAEQILERVVGMPLAALQRSFDGWLLHEYQIMVSHPAVVKPAPSPGVMVDEDSSGTTTPDRSPGVVVEPLEEVAVEPRGNAFNKEAITAMYQRMEVLKSSKTPCVKRKYYRKAKRNFIKLASDPDWKSSDGVQVMVQQTDAGGAIPQHLQGKARAFVDNANLLFAECGERK